MTTYDEARSFVLSCTDLTELNVLRDDIKARHAELSKAAARDLVRNLNIGDRVRVTDKDVRPVKLRGAIGTITRTTEVRGIPGFVVDLEGIGRYGENQSYRLPGDILGAVK